MRLSVLAFAALAWIAVGPPANAQTYDPAYPVCMQIYGPVGYFDCRYATLEQCRALAVGRPANCTGNPYFAPSEPKHAQRALRNAR